MKRIIRKVNNFAHIATLPLQYVVRHVPCPRKKKVVKVCTGAGIMLIGSTMATHPLGILPHIIWDAIAYGLHGYGALPMIKILCAHLDLENIEENSELSELKAQLEKLQKQINHENE